MADRKFSYVQVDVPEPLRSKILAFGESIPKHKLAGEGLELDPHITVRYGFHTNDPQDFSNLLGLTRRSLVKVHLGDVTLFPASRGRKADVLKIDIGGADLFSLHNRLGELPNHRTFSYHPHLTIAFMQPVTAIDYCTQMFAGYSFTTDYIVFHSKDRKRYEVAL